MRVVRTELRPLGAVVRPVVLAALAVLRAQLTASGRTALLQKLAGGGGVIFVRRHGQWQGQQDRGATAFRSVTGIVVRTMQQLVAFGRPWLVKLHEPLHCPADWCSHKNQVSRRQGAESIKHSDCNRKHRAERCPGGRVMRDAAQSEVHRRGRGAAENMERRGRQRVCVCVRVSDTHTGVHRHEGDSPVELRPVKDQPNRPAAHQGTTKGS